MRKVIALAAGALLVLTMSACGGDDERARGTTPVQEPAAPAAPAAPAGPAAEGEYGSDPALDVLWDSCAAGNMADCDELFWESPFGSAYEDFAQNCGTAGMPADQIFCDNSGVGLDVPAGPVEGGSYGDDPALDALWDACEGGDNAACDDLYMESPFGSEYEDFGDTCGGRGRPEGATWCDAG